MEKKHLAVIEENGYQYVQLYTSCPVCVDQGRFIPHAYWGHGDDNCLGDIYVGDDACFKCAKCGRTSHVTNWTVNTDCPAHSSNYMVNYVGETHQGMPPAQAISFAGQMSTLVGVGWLQRFLDNLCDFDHENSKSDLQPVLTKCCDTSAEGEPADEKIKINKFEENGISYIRLYSKCPSCVKQGIMSSEAFWKHQDENCLGDVYIGDNGFLKCAKCGKTAHARNVLRVAMISM